MEATMASYGTKMPRRMSTTSGKINEQSRALHLEGIKVRMQQTLYLQTRLVYQKLKLTEPQLFHLFL